MSVPSWYNTQQGISNYYLKNMADGSMMDSRLVKQANPLMKLFGASDEYSNTLSSNGINALGELGFNKELLQNDQFQKFLQTKGVYSFNTSTGGINLASGLNGDKVSELTTQYNNAVANGTIKDITANVNSNDTVSSNSLFGWGKNQYGQTTFGGGTGLQWLGAGLGAATSLYGMYNANKAMKLAKQNFEEQKLLNHANYQMQAKAYNNNLRNQQSGRSFTGMSGSARRTLGQEYQTRKAKEDY